MSKKDHGKRISFRPSVKHEEFSLDGKNFLEISFFAIVDTVREKMELPINRNEDVFFDKFVFDIIILSFFLIFFICFFYFIPLSFMQNSSYNSENSIVQVIVLLVFCAILWGGYVYINQEFRRLVREKILPPFIKNHLINIGLYTLLPRIFCGTYYEWESGIGFRMFDRTLLSGIFIGFMGIVVFGRQILGLLVSTIFYLNFQALEALSILLFNFFIIGLILFVFLYAILTVLGIFIYLFLVVRFLPLDIDLLIDLGGTGKFGKIIINCLYLVSFAMGMIPLFLLFSKFEKIKILIPQESFSTIGNFTESMRSTAITSIKDLPVSTFSENFAIFEVFFLFIGAAIVIILSLHYQIKERKNTELVKLENMIKTIDILPNEDKEKCEHNLYLLTLYEKVLNLYEWPIRRIFIVELIISTIPLFISLVIL